MLDAFKCSVLLLLFPMFTVVQNNRTHKKSLFLTVEERAERNMPVQDSEVINWMLDALEYETGQINPLQKIYDQLHLLSKSPFGFVKLQNLTVKQSLARITAITTEGNYIPYINMSIGSYVQKPTIVVVAGIHGCDWLGVAAVMHLIQQFVIYYYKYAAVLEKLTWVVVPVLNPDGYNATISNEKMKNWRKNMYKPNITLRNENCFGVDLGLNFEYQWLNYDFENITFCDEHYADRPFTQDESRALKDTIRDHLDSVHMYVTVAQKRRAFTYPYRYTAKKPLFAGIFEGIVKSAARAASRQHGRHFDSGHILKFEEPSAGDIDDWIKAHFDVQLAFTCFISDWHDNYHTLTHTEIERTNDELLAALTIIAEKGIGFDANKYLPTNSGSCVSLIVVNIFNLFIMMNIFLNKIF